MSLKLRGPKLLPKKCNISNIVLFLHGYGANGNDLISLSSFWKDILPETAFYSPNAPFSTDFGPDSYQWFDLLKRTKDEMRDGLAKSGPYLNNYIEEILNENNLDIHKLLVVGFSQGTIMALDHMSKRSSPCAGVIGYSGMFFEDEDCQKNIQCTFPILLCHGKNDEVIPYESSNIATKTLNNLGFSVKCNILDDLGHGINEKGLLIGKKFIKSVLGV